MCLFLPVLIWVAAISAVATITIVGIGSSFFGFDSDFQPAAFLLNNIAGRWKHDQRTENGECGSNDQQVSNSCEGNESPSDSSSYSSSTENSHDIRVHNSSQVSSSNISSKNTSLKKRIFWALFSPFRVFKRVAWTIMVKLSAGKRRQSPSSTALVSPNDNGSTATSFHDAATPKSSNYRNDSKFDMTSLAVPLNNSQRTQLQSAADKLRHMIVSSSHLFRGNSHHIQSMVTPQFVFRYFDSMDWTTDYHGLSYEMAMFKTLLWRHREGLNGKLNALDLQIPPQQKTIVYMSRTLDRKGRAIIYARANRLHEPFPECDYQRMIFYAVERACRFSEEKGCGTFVTVVDLTGFSLRTCPSFNIIRSIMNDLKLHYPNRNAANFLVNVTSGFLLLWNTIKPLLPPKVQEKTIVLSKSTTKRNLRSKLGKDRLESQYGGVIAEADSVALSAH